MSVGSSLLRGQDLLKALRLIPGYEVIVAAHTVGHFILNYFKFSIAWKILSTLGSACILN